MYDRAIKFVDDFFNGYTNYKPTWNYEDGCVLKGAADLYDATG
jgi:unsaturated rhamnogalacturonyl hydrolase